jgi:hypothetical protein
MRRDLGFKRRQGFAKAGDMALRLRLTLA